MTDNGNYDLIPRQLFKEYLERDTAFALFLQDKAREFEQRQLAVEPIIKVVKYHKRRDQHAKTYYTERSKILSFYALLQEQDINTGDLIAAAEERLETSEVVRVVPYSTDEHDSLDPFKSVTTLSVSSALRSACADLIPPDPIECVTTLSVSSALRSACADLIPPDPIECVTTLSVSSVLRSPSSLISPDPEQIYFVSKHDLVNDSSILDSACHSSLFVALLEALESRNYEIAGRWLTKAITTGVPFCEYDRRRLIYEAYRSDNIEIWESVSVIVGRTEMLGGMCILQTIARNNSHIILSHLVQIDPAQVRRLATNTGQDPPIHMAAHLGHTEVVEILLDYTDPDVVLGLCRNVSLLTAAASNKHNRTVEMLITKSCIKDLIGKIGYGGYTALHYAAQDLDYSTFKKLYDVYAESPSLLALSTQDGYTAFHIMIHSGDEARVRQFISDVGPNCPLLYMVDRHGQTPLHWAAHKGMGDTVDALYGIYAEKGLLLAKTSECRYTFFIYLVQGKHTTIISKLIERIDFDPRLVSEADRNGQTVMMWAIDMCEEICELLYEHSVTTGSITAARKRGNNALTYAIMSDLSSVVELLTSDPDLCNEQMLTDPNGYTPFHNAIDSSLEVCARIYQQSSVDTVCMQTDHHMLTALHMAVLYRGIDMVKVLLGDQVKTQALVGIRDADGKTALDYACMRSPEMALVIQAAMELQ